MPFLLVYGSLYMLRPNLQLILGLIGNLRMYCLYVVLNKYILLIVRKYSRKRKTINTYNLDSQYFLGFSS